MAQINNRIHAMDTIRGLASLQVLINHCLVISIFFWNLNNNILAVDNNLILKLFSFSPLRILWSGHEAVILFFVMSGFVLAIPVYNQKKTKYREFFVKRMFRIYGPYLVTISIGILLNNLFSNHGSYPALSDWFTNLWDKKITTLEVLNFLILKGDWLNVVTSLWTLPVEIKISLIFPFAVLIQKRLNLGLALLWIFLNIVAYMIGKRLGFQANWADFSMFYYLTFFLSGSLLYKKHIEILSIINKFNRRWLVLMFMLAIFMYTYDYWILTLPANILKFATIIPGDYTACLASLLFVILSISEKAPQWLLNKHLKYLGQISFSLYLIHPIIIGVVCFTLGRILPIYFIIPICMILSLLMAMPFNRWVEVPLQKLGRKLSAKRDSALIRKEVPVVLDK